MKLSKQNLKYSAIISVTDTPFSRHRLIIGDGLTPEEAAQACETKAKSAGWQAPKNWQLWRRNDSRQAFVSPRFP